jgi:hypothetical protein
MDTIPPLNLLLFKKGRGQQETMDVRNDVKLKEFFDNRNK